MKTVKRSISAVMIILVMTMTIPLHMLSAFAATNPIQTYLDEIKAVYPADSYFSANRKACSHSSGSACSNCKLATILNSTDGKSIKRYENSKYNSSTWTCFSFVSFWFTQYSGYSYVKENYIKVKDSNDLFSSRTDFSKQSDAKKKEFFSYAKLGYIIKCFNWTQSNGYTHKHSMIFISADDTGINVYDANVGGNSSTTGKVRYGKIKYANVSWYNIELLKAKNYDDIVGKASTIQLNYAANGGSGSMSAQNINYDQKTNLKANAFTRNGYTFAGWYAKRNADNKWFVPSKGWLTESEISKNNYNKKLYADKAELTFNSSWTEGASGTVGFTLYAQWTEDQADEPESVSGTVTIQVYDTQGGHYADNLACITTSLTRNGVLLSTSRFQTGEHFSDLEPGDELLLSTELLDSANKECYAFRCWVDGNGNVLSTSKDLLITVETEEFEIYATYVQTKNEYYVEYASNGHGSITYATDAGLTEESKTYIALVEGNDIEFSFTPNEGYVLDLILLDGNPLPLWNNPLTLSNIQGNHSVYVEFKEIAVSNPQMSLSSSKAKAGERVDVTLFISDNPGIIATSVNLTYDKTVLRLIDVQNGEVFETKSFSPGRDYTVVPYTVIWEDGLATQNHTENGILAVYTFEVLDTAPAGETLIGLNYTKNSTLNADIEEVEFTPVGGSVEIIDRTPGDVNGDGVVDLKDTVILGRYLSGGWNVTIIESNADVNGDHMIDLKDTVILRRYLSGGWNVELK